jgi:N-acetylmuramoyl-L-alanine amidase
MLKRLKIFIAGVALLLVSLGALDTDQAQAAALLTKGVSSGDVWDLQYRLRTLGYDQLVLDGQFGSQTLSVVRQFQRDYGLPSDGVVGKKTWKVLKTYSLNQRELDIMAKVINSEARGEPYVGQVAVGAVIMNRIQSGQFPNNIHGVVFQSGAFTAVDDGQYALTPNKSAYLAAHDALRGWDPTNQSLYYFNPETATSKWIWSRPQTVSIGQHIFAK